MPANLIPIVIILVLLLWLMAASLRLCNEWERKVVLRLGRFTGVRGPGIFFLLPHIETTPFTIDMRVQVSSFVAEQTLTKDGASVTVDTLVYWRVVDAGRAAIQVANYSQAVMGAAQGALRDIIGRNDLSTLLSQRRELDEQLTLILDEQTEPWGIKVQVVQQFAQAGELYRSHPTALHLRGMNMLYETMRSGMASVIVVPSSALDSMNLGAIGGISALGQGARPPASEGT